MISTNAKQWDQPIRIAECRRELYFLHPRYPAVGPLPKRCLKGYRPKSALSFPSSSLALVKTALVSVYLGGNPTTAPFS
jgi:hypothetical protein